MVGSSPQTCKINNAEYTCYSVDVVLELAIKSDEEQNLVLRNIIIEVFGVDDLVDALQLGLPFDAISLVGIDTNSPTDPPSPAPSKVPSSPPTNNPTKLPTTSSPTLSEATHSPTMMPTSTQCKSLRCR